MALCKLRHILQGSDSDSTYPRLEPRRMASPLVFFKVRIHLHPIIQFAGIVSIQFTVIYFDFW